MSMKIGWHSRGLFRNYADDVALEAHGPVSILFYSASITAA